LQRLEQAQAVETERARVARDLHDELGGGVTALGLLYARLRPAPDPEARDLHRLLGERIHRLGLDLERVVWTASPRNDSLERFAAFTARFAAHYFRGTGVRCVVALPEEALSGPLAPAVRHHLSAILRESLHNALKHADAREVRVTLTATPTLLVLEVQDDGRGVDLGALADDAGHGLRNLRERAARLGATLTLDSAPGQGFTLRLSTPLPVTCTP
jgi:signal transduction histidine kinase